MSVPFFLAIILEDGLLQLPVLSAGGDENGDIGIGILPESEESIVGCSGLCCLARKRERAGKSKLGQRANRLVYHHAWPIQDFLKLRGRLSSAVSEKQSLPANINRIQIRSKGAVARKAQFIR